MRESDVKFLADRIGFDERLVNGVLHKLKSADVLDVEIKRFIPPRPESFIGGPYRKDLKTDVPYLFIQCRLISNGKKLWKAVLDSLPAAYGFYLADVQLPPRNKDGGFILTKDIDDYDLIFLNQINRANVEISNKSTVRLYKRLQKRFGVKLFAVDRENLCVVFDTKIAAAEGLIFAKYVRKYCSTFECMGISNDNIVTGIQKFDAFMFHWE